MQLAARSVASCYRGWRTRATLHDLATQVGERVAEFRAWQRTQKEQAQYMGKETGCSTSALNATRTAKDGQRDSTRQRRVDLSNITLSVPRRQSYMIAIPTPEVLLGLVMRYSK